MIATTRGIQLVKWMKSSHILILIGVLTKLLEHCIPLMTLKSNKILQLHVHEQICRILIYNIDKYDFDNIEEIIVVNQ